MLEFPNIKSRKRKVRKLQEEKMDNFIKKEERRKLNFDLKDSDGEDENENVENEEQKLDFKANNADIKMKKRTRKLKRQEKKTENDFFELKDEVHVRNYFIETEKSKKNERKLKSNLRRNILETDTNNDLNNKNNSINFNNKSIEFEIEMENKIEDSGVHLSEGFVYVYIASDNEVVKEAFAEFLKEFHSHIRGTKNACSCKKIL